LVSTDFWSEDMSARTAKLDAELLSGIRRELKRLRGLDEWSFDRTAVSAREAVRNAKQGIVAIDLTAWLRRVPTVAESSAAYRALDRLEAKGVLKRCLGGMSKRYKTHVQLVETAVAADKVLETKSSYTLDLKK
jgi:hypothetical protein